MLTVYTTLFGDRTRDQLRQPPPDGDTRYVCFTDGPVVAPGWETVGVGGGGQSPILLARLFKMRPDHWFGPEMPTVWVDASCQLLRPPSALLTVSPAPVIGLQHPHRHTVEEEAAEVTRTFLAPATQVQAQLRAYRAEGFAVDAGPLTTTGLLVRRPAARAFNCLWESQLLRYHLRDQLSVDYAAWATGTAIAHLPGSYRQNAFMRYHVHARVA